MAVLLIVYMTLGAAVGFFSALVAVFLLGLLGLDHEEADGVAASLTFVAGLVAWPCVLSLLIWIWWRYRS
jgi:hypothetical protein